ncbi:putative pectinesterase/pectinesterase inhibitor 20 [Apium graveolens]|uniref:putative pectinesterase/pectinesterase inhibitor 20 n=1 Tax=Apium graveolens TaxID=4045 RepID=UPI003D7B76EC
MHFLACLVSLFLMLCIPCPLVSASKDTICNDTPFPSFCKSILPSNDSFSIYDHGRFSINQSISSAKSLMSLVQGFLDHQDFASSENMIHALEDCTLLESLNVDYLSKTLETIRTTNALASLEDEDNLLTLLSATLTNQQTCLDGLQSISSPSNPQSTLQSSLFNGTMMYSVSLAIFRHGWVSATRQRRTLKERKLGRKQTSPGLVLYPGGNVVKVSQTVVVNASGGGDFRTISDAVAAAPNNTDGSNGFFVIRALAGTYDEYVNIASTKKYLMMIGDGINNTIITGNRSVADNFTTFNTATLIVTGQGFVGVNMTIRNTAGASNYQAVAVRSNADTSTFYRCSFEAYQDTLYTHSLRQFYRECDIYGTIDFIFGNAAVVFQNCNIFPRLPIQGQYNTITAQGRTDINQNTGTSVQNCSITVAENLGSTATYLGRPWKQYSRAVYMQSFMDSLIDPVGWIAWSGDFALNTSYYAEFNNSGPGSNTSSRVTWESFHIINATDAVNFTVSNFISGASWLPATGVPYNANL